MAKIHYIHTLVFNQKEVEAESLYKPLLFTLSPFLYSWKGGLLMYFCLVGILICKLL